ncbi:MAG TPA: cytochrome c oxidase subunit II [Rhizomicrobium sp.]
MTKTLLPYALPIWFALARPAVATPLDYLHAAGRKAAPVVALTWGVITISIVVIVIISVLLAGAIWRRPGSAAIPGSRLALEPPVEALNWLWLGVGISTLVLLFSVVWTMIVLAKVTSPITKPALTIEVTGRQWWWQVRYLNSDPDQIFSTANEIHIPAGQPILFKLVGGDVIHSFWVPALSGKTDTIPGLTNEMWLEADKPGLYYGQCTEYCGLQHAKMGLLVVADTPRNFSAWWNHQLRSPQLPTKGDQWAGLANFNMYCGSCHAVRGTSAAGMLGPDLSHLMQRHSLAAGVLPNNPADLERWISDPQGIKPGSLMQKPELSARELADVQAYLKTLD